MPKAGRHRKKEWKQVERTPAGNAACPLERHWHLKQAHGRLKKTVEGGENAFAQDWVRDLEDGKAVWHQPEVGLEWKRLGFEPELKVPTCCR